MIRLLTIGLLALGLGLPLLAGCDETVSHEKDVKVNDDEKVVEEKTVTRDPDDGTITTETEKSREDR